MTRFSALANGILAHAPPRFGLAGLSMGGIVAMEVLRLAPERVERIALIGTSPLAERPEATAERELQIAAVQAGGLRRVMRDEMKPRYVTDGPHRQAILDLCMVMATGLGADVFVRQSRALQTRRDQCDTLRGANLPSLVLCGESDALCPPKRHRLMHDLIRGSRLEIVPGAGHLTTLEQPEPTNAALARWLEAE